MNPGPAIMTPLLWAAGDNPRQPLTEEERALLAAIATIVRFKKREIIYGEGDDANSVFNIVSGVVKSYKTLSDGSQHIVGFLFSNDLLGLAENGKYVNSTAAVTSTTLYRMPTAALEVQMNKYPHLDFAVISKICHDLREAQHHAFLLSKQRAIEKMGLFLQLLETHEAVHGISAGEVYLPMSRSDIGAYAGISPEAVSRSLRDLINRGVVSVRDRRHIKIIDRQQLETLIYESRLPQLARSRPAAN